MPDVSKQTPSILFVDDEAINLMVEKAWFSHRYTVFTATSVDEALEVLQRESIDAVVSDQRMPGRLGTDLFRLLAEEDFAGLRVILTAYSEDEVVQKALWDGIVDEVMDKPLQIERLVAFVEGLRVGSGKGRSDG